MQGLDVKEPIPPIPPAVVPTVSNEQKNTQPEDVFSEQRKKIKNAITLIKAGITKRKLPLQFLTGGVMLGTGIYLFWNYASFLQYKTEKYETTASLRYELQSNITSFEYKILNLTTQFLE